MPPTVRARLVICLALAALWCIVVPSEGFSCSSLLPVAPLSPSSPSTSSLRSRSFSPLRSSSSSFPSPVLSPSLLSSDFARLGSDASAALSAGAHSLHFDVMDNHFVPALSPLGPGSLSSLRAYGVAAPIDVHLMASPVDSLIQDFAKAGATSITFHPEASVHVHRSLQLIKSLGCKAGLAFNPSTPLDVYKYVSDDVDVLLLMSVNPGFGGQTFLPLSLGKVAEAAAMVASRGRRGSTRIAVDGGVNKSNARDIARRGADTFVAGSAIFKEPRTVEAYRESVEGLMKEIRAGRKEFEESSISR